MRGFGKAVLAINLALVTAPLVAEELGGLTWHGFVSQGFIDTSHNDLFFGQTSQGMFEYNEVALNFSIEPRQRLRIGAQLVSRDLGSEGNHHVLVDWAQGDYKALDAFGVRFGRIKLPFGLYGVLRDADIGRPEIYSPEGVYTELLKDVARAYDGAGVYGTAAVGRGWLEYEVFGGTVDVDGATIARRVVLEGLYPVAQGLSARGLGTPVPTVGTFDATMKHVFGGALEWRPARGLRLKATGLKQRSTVRADSHIEGTLGGLPVALPVHTETTFEHDYYVVASAEFERGPLRVSAEHNWQKVLNTLRVEGLPTGPLAPPTQVTKPKGWYVQAVVRAGERWQLGGYYSVAYRDSQDQDGQRYVAAGRDDFEAWDKDLTFHARFDPIPNLFVKAEYHSIDGAGRLSPFENPQGLTQNWHIFVAKATCHF